MDRRTALIDCDGVLCDFVGGVLALTLEVTGIQLVPEDFPPTWYLLQNLADVLRNKGQDNPHRAAAEVLRRMQLPGFCAELQPFPGAQEAVQRIERAYTCVIATTPCWAFEHWTAERLQWVQRHLALPARRVVFLENKEMLRGAFLLDDRPETVKAWATVNRCTNPATSPAMLWSTYFNKEAEGLRRMSTWADVFEVVKV